MRYLRRIRGGGSSIVTSGLVMHLDALDAASYPGSGTAWTDLSGNGNNATLVNSPTWNSSGWFAWNGTNQRATVTRMVSGDFSLECWFRTTSTAGTSGSGWYLGRGLIDAEVGGVTNDFGLAIGNGEVMFGVREDANTIRHSAPYNGGTWVQIVATRLQSSGAVLLFANGTQVASGTSSTNTLNASSIISIAAIQTNTNFFAGDIAISRIYNRALPLPDIEQNLNANRSRFGI
jgi:hypothetical protein